MRIIYSVAPILMLYLIPVSYNFNVILIPVFKSNQENHTSNPVYVKKEIRRRQYDNTDTSEEDSSSEEDYEILNKHTDATKPTNRKLNIKIKVNYESHSSESDSRDDRYYNDSDVSDEYQSSEIDLTTYPSKIQNKKKRKDEAQRIVGGYSVQINEYPYTGMYGENCACTIIHERFALTVAHCGRKPWIQVGSKFHRQGDKYDIIKYMPHPKSHEIHKEHLFDYDFQIVELKTALIFSENIGKVKIAKPSDMQEGIILTVTGWGRLVANDDDPSEELQAVQVPIVSEHACQQVKFPFYQNTLTSRMFCAGYIQGEKDACQGDSGGPAVADGKLFGLVSFGYGCATPDSFGVYSKVSEVRDWIQIETGTNLD